jgi:hypothetical protein
VDEYDYPLTGNFFPRLALFGEMDWRAMTALQERKVLDRMGILSLTSGYIWGQGFWLDGLEVIFEAVEEVDEKSVEIQLA